MIRAQDGDHNGRFTLPSGEGVHGTLTLASDRPPTISLHPDDPGDLTQRKGFPQESRAAELTGYLFSNDEVIVKDVSLSEWFPQQIEASGRWALVGLEITRVPDRRWSSVQLQVSGLETVLGNAISSIVWPRDARVDPQRLSAELNASADYASAANGVTIRANYRYSFPTNDPYRFSITNYPTVTLTTQQPLTVDEWVTGWLLPLRELLTLATGERERIAAVRFTAPDPQPTGDDVRRPVEIAGQLFGSGIHQEEQPARRRTRPDGTPLIPLFLLADAPPLADLAHTWLTSLGERTATTLYWLSTDTTLPPSVRYLLCAQALESLHAEAHAAKEYAEDAAHDAKRTAALAALAAVGDDVLDAGTKRFLRRNLLRKPARSLASRLHHTIATIPNHDTLVGAWMDRTAPLVPRLASHDHPTSTLHERLAAIRNVLSHGTATLPPREVHAATRILEALLRGQLLAHLRFSPMQLATAYAQMTGVTDA
jgi:ApeA N-terminal domain 1